MAADFLHPDTAGNGRSATRVRKFPGQYGPPTRLINWRAARTAGGCHHRVSRQALEAAGATVLDINSGPPSPHMWPVARFPA
jgi:hypothetical protein